MKKLLNNKEKIFSLINEIDKDGSNLYTHILLNDSIMSLQTISIVMTSSNRSKQTYYTLDTITNSKYKDIQVIIVDDSTNDPLMESVLSKYNFRIDFIKINRDSKTWINPVVNYNIGFKYIEGGKIIIQNAEVCHVGDVIDFLAVNMIDSNYYVFDVAVMDSFEANEILQSNKNLNVDVYNISKLYNSQIPWYQNKNYRRNFHFLTALSTKTFNLVGGFSYDYTMGQSYDDDDFLLRIISNKINIVNIHHEYYLVGGIHQYHKLTEINVDMYVENEMIFLNKKQFYSTKGEYVNITDDVSTFDIKHKLLSSLN